MWMRRGSAFALVAVLAACSDPSTSPTVPATDAAIGGGVSFARREQAGYKVYRNGSTTDAQTLPAGGAYLAGGGTDVDAGMVWLMAQGGTRGPGEYGDVVVLRT